VGSVTARTAHSHGATVWLAMRDVSKDLPDLDKAEEEAGRYHRVKADLTKPESLSAAVKTSGATKAFIYLAFGSPDSMKGSLQAMKSAGIDFIVFLSSYTISHGPAYGDAKAVPPQEIIPYVHAQVELNIEAIFGSDHYVALRPGGFATNMLHHKAGIAKGKVRLRGTQYRFDLITPDDMGRVAGTILATQDGPRDGQRHVYIHGPQVLSNEAAIKTVGKILGKEVEVIETDDAEAMKQFGEQGYPEPIARYILSKATDDLADEEARPKHQEGVDNVRKYTGRESTSWEDWVKDNKSRFEV
jgi:nucleoside-diphosphate-sugar epimerase